jgi:alkylation response protein AidB-like acyl-CoA dehydrogenase
MLTEEQTLIQETARNFSQDVLAPGAKARETNRVIEPAVITQMGELGLLGVTISDKNGGVGADYTSYALALMEVAEGDGAVSTMMSVHNAPFCAVLEKFGSKNQRRAWLLPAAQGAFIGSFALTEAHTGSDAKAIRTRAERRGNDWVLNGDKQFISSANISGATIVFAVTDPDAARACISAFYVENTNSGMTVGPPEEKLGQKASDTCALRFEDMVVSADNMIGVEGQGLGIALSSLETGRIGISAQAVGMAQAALSYAVQYATERQSFGQPIFQHQAVGFKLAQMDVEVEAARQLVLNAARVKDSGAPCLREASIAKLYASEMAERVCSGAIQVLGGYGYLADYPVERIYRDVRVCQIYEGTSEIQKINISRELAKRYQA